MSRASCHSHCVCGCPLLHRLELSSDPEGQRPGECLPRPPSHEAACHMLSPILWTGVETIASIAFVA